MNRCARGSWSGKIGFVLAAAGSAVGLGNLWKFPYLAYKHGGGIDGKGAGAFVFIYLASVAAIGLPAMMAEIIIGKRTGRNAVGAFKTLRPGTSWKYLGGLGVATGFVLLSYYSVIAGWSARYVLASLTGEFSGSLPREIQEHSNRFFTSFLADPWQQIAWTGLFLAVTAAVVVGGVATGIERCSKALMPLLLGILVFLLFYISDLSGATNAYTYLFQPDLTSVDSQMVLEAMGQAFFSLSLGMGAMITYGSYLSRKENAFVGAVAITLLDITVALVASVVIFGIIFHLQIQMPGQGVGNLFTAMPVVFAQISGRGWLICLFYILVAFAALTSTISLLEVVVAYFIDERGWQRTKAVIIVSIAEFIVAVPSALSFNLAQTAKVGNKTFFDWADYLCANWSLPIGGLLITLFAGWFLTRREKLEELGGNRRLTSIWTFVVRYVTPAAILAVIIGLVLGAGSGG